MTRFSYRMALTVAGLAAALLIADYAFAQGGGGGGGGRRGGGRFGMGGQMSGLMLLRAEPVQNELELTDDQKKAVDQLASEMRQGGGGGGGGQNLSEEERAKRREERQAREAETQKKLDAILLPNQRDRLAQISIQVRGAGALADEKVASALSLSDDQKKQLETIREESGAKMREAFQGGGDNQDRQAAMAKMAEMRKEQDDKALAVLTADQKGKLEQMKGKKVDFDVSQLFNRRGQGQGGGGGGQRTPEGAN